MLRNLPFVGHFPVMLRFGERPDLFNKATYAGSSLRGHPGIDFALPEGTPVVAVQHGVVLEIRERDAGYGRSVLIGHRWGQTFYAHLDEIRVQEGQQIGASQIIGLSGSSGHAEQPHLHFGMRLIPYAVNDGWCGFTDPEPYLTRLTEPRGAIVGPHITGAIAPHLDLLARWQPRLITLLDPDPDEVTALREVCPQSVVVARVNLPELDLEESIRSDPGKAANTAHDVVRSRRTPGVDYWQVANEVLQDIDTLPALAKFELTRMRLAERSGFRCAILGFGVGNPDLPEGDRLNAWRRVFPALERAEKRGHIVALHQYGMPDLWGPNNAYDWYIFRLEHQVLRRLPFRRLKFAVTEFGINGLIRGDQPAGWQTFTTPEGYVEQLLKCGRYLERFSGQVLGYTVFTLGHSVPWATYDIAGKAATYLADLSEKGTWLEVDTQVFDISPRETDTDTAPGPEVNEVALAAGLDQDIPQPEAPAAFAAGGAAEASSLSVSGEETGGSVLEDLIPPAATAAPSAWEQADVDTDAWTAAETEAVETPEEMLDDAAAFAGVAAANAWDESDIPESGDEFDADVFDADAFQPETPFAAESPYEEELEVEPSVETSDESAGEFLAAASLQDEEPELETQIARRRAEEALIVEQAEGQQAPLEQRIAPAFNRYNMKVMPITSRPDKPGGDIVYLVKDVFMTYYGSWEPAEGKESVADWAREAYLKPEFLEAGADHHLFAAIIGLDGEFVHSHEVIFWSDGFERLGDPTYNAYSRERTKDNSGWANMFMAGGSSFVPDIGETGPWCWAPVGAAEVVCGGGLPLGHPVSTFVVWQAVPRERWEAGEGTQPINERPAPPAKPTPLPTVETRISEWISTYNVSIKPISARPDHPTGNVVYMVRDMFTTRNGSWEPMDLPGSVPQWARDEYLKPLNAPDVFDDAGGDHHLFAAVIGLDGQLIREQEILFWSDGFERLGEADYDGYINRMTKVRSGWANVVTGPGSSYVPERGESGPWCWAPNGVSEVVCGGGLPSNHHISFFVVWQAIANPEGGAGGDDHEIFLPITPSAVPGAAAGPAVEINAAAILALRTAVWSRLGVEFKPDSVLAAYARQVGLGMPVTQEFEVAGIRAQGFQGGIAYVTPGDRGRLGHLSW